MNFPDLYSFSNDPVMGTGVYPCDSAYWRVLKDNQFYRWDSDNGWVVEYSSYSVSSSSPSDYYTNVTTGNYTLEEY